MPKLDALDSDFRTHHHAFIDEEILQGEQNTLDEHDDLVAQLAVRIQQLITLCTSSLDSSPRKIASRRLSHLQKTLSTIGEAITSSDVTADPCLLRQYEEQLGDVKRELTDIRNSLLPLDEADDLCTSQAGLEGKVFDCSLQIKKLLHHPSEAPSSTTTNENKLPKLEVRTFDGNILHWRSFWDQFCVSVPPSRTRRNLCTSSTRSRTVQQRR